VAINPVDWKIIEGALKMMAEFKLPAVLGHDVAGIVSSVGGSVTKFKVGDKVYARVDHDKMGTFAEYCVTSDASVALMPASLSFDQSASLPLAGLTALQAIRDVGQFPTGGKILILGASGGVGTLAVQLAAHVFKASEVVVTCSAGNAEPLKSLGATRMVDYKTQDYTEEIQEMDFVFDTVGDVNHAFKSCKRGGTVVSISAGYTAEGLRRAGMEVSVPLSVGLAAMSAPTLALAALHGCTYHFVWMKPDGAELLEFAQWIESGAVKPVVDRTFSGFEQVREAFEYQAEGHSKGKVVIHLQDA